MQLHWLQKADAMKFVFLVAALAGAMMIGGLVGSGARAGRCECCPCCRCVGIYWPTQCKCEPKKPDRNPGEVRP